MIYFAFCYFLLLASCQAQVDSPQTDTTHQESVVNKTAAKVPAVAVAQSNDSSDTTPFVFPYKLSKPEKSLEMPSQLTEISGLSILPNGWLASVQDEKGRLYLINKYDGKIERKINFGGDGDYEGVEIIGDNAYIVNSSGTIYEVIGFLQEEPVVNKYNTFLKSNNNIEGLSFDKKNNCLLLACKGRPAKGETIEDFTQYKTIYAFDLASKNLKEQPAYTISLAAVQDYINTKPTVKGLDKLIEQFAPPAKRLEFNPSAIATHPVTQDIYILSSSGKSMLVMDQEGRIKYMQKLKKKIHTQPEGITFTEDGTLYISNEGSGKKAKIHVFKPQEGVH